MKTDMDWIENGKKNHQGGLKKQNYYNLSYWLTNGVCLLRSDVSFTVNLIFSNTSFLVEKADAKSSLSCLITSFVCLFKNEILRKENRLKLK